MQNCYTDCIANVKSTDPQGQEAEIKAFVAKYAKEMQGYIEAK